ncbi:MAG: ribosomal-protein-alanine N-acetyltransferase [Halioglobus sp.]
MNSQETSMKTLQTPRLIIEPLNTHDAAITMAILNDPDFIAYVGDRGVRSLEDAKSYIVDRLLPHYQEHGYGMTAVRRRDNGETIGMCGLVNRDSLNYIDIGYAFLPSARGEGFALEACQAVMEMGKKEVGLNELAAIISPQNKASQALAVKLGMVLDCMVRLEPGEDEICLYLWRR